MKKFEIFKNHVIIFSINGGNNDAENIGIYEKSNRRI